MVDLNCIAFSFCGTKQIMFITLTNHNRSKNVDLAYVVDNYDGNKEIEVHEISYTIKWLNVTGKDYYIEVKKGDGHVERFVLPDDYYNFCIMKDRCLTLWT